MLVHTRLTCLLLAVLLAGCAGHDRPPPPTFSPTGEPLVPPQWPADCEEAEDAWFDRLDTAHTGQISRAQLLADAKVQYQRMDMRHDDKVTAEELSRYRLQEMHGHYLSVSTPGQQSNVGRGRNDDLDRPGDRLDSGYDDEDTRHSRRGEDRPIDAYAALVTDQPDPVMSADTDLNGSVSWEEFQVSIIADFAHFDQARKGFLTKSDIHVNCGKDSASWF